MKILVCGGRDYIDWLHLYRVLDEANHDGNIEICHGGARGADALAGIWARSRGVECKVYHADWQKHGKSAGHIRNKQMLEDFKPDAVIAFPGGAGTKNMIRLAQKAGVTVWIQNQ